MARPTNSGTYGLLIILSAVFAYLLVGQNYFPVLGLAVFLAGLGSLVFFTTPKNSTTWTIYLSALTFCFFLVYRANPFLSFLNVMAVIYLGSILTIGHATPAHLLDSVLSPISVFLSSLTVKSRYQLQTQELKNIKFQSFAEQLPSVLISILVLAIIVPLLAYSNPFFEKLVQDISVAFNLQNLFDNLFREQYLVYWIRVAVFGILLLFIPRLISFAQKPNRDFVSIFTAVKLPSLTLPKLVVILVLVVFFITQAQLYFASPQTLLDMGYTNSRYAREVFAQLSIVALIIYGLIYSDKDKHRLSKLTTYLLIVEGLFLTLVAFKSDYDYSSAWGFTHKRLYGFAVATWIAGIFLLFAYKYFAQLPKPLHNKHIVIYSAAILLAINLLNFDFLIYHYAKSTTHSGIDHHYLSNLSTDAHSTPEHFSKLVSEVIVDQTSQNPRLLAPTYNVLDRIEHLQQKYTHPQIQSFNFSEYSEYLQVRDINTASYRQFLSQQIAH